MAPPFFFDLGKSARDVSARGYNFGFLKADTTTRNANIEFKTNIAQNINSGKLFGGLDVKYKLPQYGTILVERWNTDNVCTAEITVDDKFLKGLRLVIDSSYAPFVGKRSARAKGEYKHEKISVCGEVKADGTGGPIFSGSAVVGRGLWNIGCSAGYDPSKSKLTHQSIAFSLDQNEFGFHSFVNNGKEFGGNIYHKVSQDMELAANLAWTQGEQETRFGVAAKIDLDKDTVLRTKINSASQLAFALTNTLKQGLKVTVSAAISLQNLNDGNHKLGIGFEYSP